MWTAAEGTGRRGVRTRSAVAREGLRRSRLAGRAAHPFGARAELGARVASGPRACVSTAESERAFRSPAPARQPGRSALSAAGGPRGDARAAARSPPCSSETLRPSAAPLESWTSFWVMLFWIGLCTSGLVVLWVSAHTWGTRLHIVRDVEGTTPEWGPQGWGTADRSCGEPGPCCHPSSLPPSFLVCGLWHLLYQ